jgi:hypothetical protein
MGDNVLYVDGTRARYQALGMNRLTGDAMLGDNLDNSGTRDISDSSLAMRSWAGCARSHSRWTRRISTRRDPTGSARVWIP